MIAYNKQFISNLAIVKKAKQWYARNLITAEQMNVVLNKYHSDFYNPNLFVKIGLFIFTAISISAAFGFFAFFSILTRQNADLSIGFAIFNFLFFAVLSIVVLELFIRSKTLYRSGVDEALLYSAIIFLFSGISTIIDDYSTDGMLFTFMILLPFITFAAIRYIDTIAAILTILCVYAISFLLILKFGDIAKLIMPFALMALSAIIYFIVKKKKKQEKLIFWKNSLIAFESVAMIMFYSACNYFVIRESSIELFNMQIAEGEDIPLAFVFYLFTAIVPLLYVFYGLKNKDKISLWVGLLLVAAAVLTFKYYFSLGHPEITLTVAGIAMILIAFISIRYLKTDKYEITLAEDIDEDNFLKTNAEALIIAQSFSHHVQQSQQTENNFGGGDFGGAGSGGKF